jgi:succinoglycan biosynthesis transport protein ExoP
MESLDNELRVRDYGRMLWRRRGLIILIPIVLVGLSLGYSVSSTKIYQGTAVLLLTPQLSSTLLQANNSNVPAPLVDVPTDTQIIESAAVKNLAKKSVPNPPTVSVTQIGTTNAVQVSAQSPNAKVASAAATAYAKAFISLQHQQAVNALTSASQVVQTHLNTVQASIDSLNNQIAHAGSNADTSGLTTQLASQEQVRATLQGELSNYEFAASLATGGGEVLTAATVPTKPVKPKTIEFAVLAGILGLAVGVALALILEFLDDGIRTKEDVELVAKNLPVLGLIPEIDQWRDTRAEYLVSRSAPTSVQTEAYRSLRTSIQFLGLDQSLRVLQFTSPNAAEGKTTTMANLALVMAEAGQRVAVVCCDLRRPRIHEFFGLSNQVGFTSVLLGDASLSEALQPMPGLENLGILASGPIPPNPSELLSGTRAAEVLTTLADNADIVLVDSPPVLPVTDASVLASRVDAVVLVVAARRSTRSQVKRSIEMLEQVHAPLSGVVLNRASEPDNYSYYQYTYRNSSNGKRSLPNGASPLMPQETSVD